jgi:Cdc6-like AAA superfamily ATPase
MPRQPSLANDRLPYLEWIIACAFLWVVYVGLFTPITAGIGWYIERRWTFSPRFLIALSASLVLMALASRFLTPEDFFTLKHWVLLVPLVPVAVLVARGVQMTSKFLKPKTLQEHVAAQEARAKAQNERRLQQANRRVPVAGDTGWLTLGAHLDGDLLPENLGIQSWQRWVLLNESLLDQHIFLLGATGAGKTETIKRLVLEILARTDRDVYFVDGKGDVDLANDVRSLAHHYDRGDSPVFRLGFDHHGAIYHGFSGQPMDIYNRLCALIGVTEAEGDARYYADINRDLLQLICYAPGGPPRNFEDLRTRLSSSWLKTAYRDNVVEQQTLEDEITAQDIQSLARRIRPLSREFSPMVGDDGFALEDTHCAIFSMRAQSVGDTSRRFLDFLVEDLKDFVGKRQRRPAVLVIDEFGQFSNDNVISLLTLARSSRLGVVLATQDTASLKDEDVRKLVLANTRTKILMASDFPEEVGELAGTMYQVESSMQHEDGDLTGTGSARVQHAFKIDMNEAAKLQPGEAFIIRQRHVVKVKVHAVGSVDRIPEQSEEQRKPREEPSAEGSRGKRKSPPRL